MSNGAPEAEPRPPTVWIAHTSGRVAGWIAVDVASTLRRLHLEVKLWDGRDPQSLDAVRGDIVVADPTWLPMMALALGPGVRFEEARPPSIWRGGLAPRTLRRIKEHVEDRLADKVRCQDLAKMAGLSECHFSRAFKQSVGMSPHRYVMSRRVAAATSLIECTSRSLTDIALSVGFSDHSHFTRMFVRMTGETPRAYRRRHR